MSRSVASLRGRYRHVGQASLGLCRCRARVEGVRSCLDEGVDLRFDASVTAAQIGDHLAQSVDLGVGQLRADSVAEQFCCSRICGVGAGKRHREQDSSLTGDEIVAPTVCP